MIRIPKGWARVRLRTRHLGDLFVAVAGAAAALVGMLFVAVSLNLVKILEGPALPALATRSLGVLLGLRGSH